MQEDNKPSLKLISGGKEKPEKEEKSDKLTGKQEAFAQGLSEGLTNTEAYRRAYGAENMKASTIHVEACKLAQHPKIARRLDEILSEKRGKQSMFAEKQSDRVWRNVWRLAEGENVPPATQQAAIALAAKMAGMLTDQVKIENVSADSKSIERELLERLQRLSA
jgi:phage terminase small subunit